MSAQSSTRARSHRVLGGYGPVVALIAVVAVVVAVVPSKSPAKAVVAPLPTSGQGGVSGNSVGKAATGDVAACSDRSVQVPGDPYSPPCFSFAGNNGGATSKGVTGDTITVSYRVTSDPDYLSTLEAFGKSGLPADTAADVERTVEALVQYFNKNFQFYGRKIKLVPFTGQGTVLGEILGGGQEAATADAVKAATEIQPFADVSAITPPYADALARRQVVAMGAPFVSDQWFDERRPYAWSATGSCTLVAKAATEYADKLLFGRPATYAGGNLQGQPRKIALVTPDNPEYQRCADAGLAVLKAAGHDVTQLTYTLDITSMATQAASIIARLKSAGITSVACGCDPLMPSNLTYQARQQNYEPEWLVMGTALTDTDFAGQLYDQSEWSRAFGASALGDQLPLGHDLASKAYATIRYDRPATSAELLYFQLYQLAIGLQMAGPNLTPASFEAGMFNYPEHTGEGGTWSFGPGKYTPQSDVRLIAWDPQKISILDGKPGAYVVGSQRYKPGQIPTDIDPRLSNLMGARTAGSTTSTTAGGFP